MWRESTVLVTGGTGSFGKAFIQRLIKEPVKKVIVFSRDEYKQSEMAREVTDGRVRFLLGDVRDKDRLIQALSGVDYVVHAAALKQVPALEYNPTEAVRTNVDGARNLVDAAVQCGVKQVVALSTDKAVNPVNLYGATKLCAEKIFTAANAFGRTKFCSVRYGNVIGSRGSVIPLFLELRDKGQRQVPITHFNMTRFWITLRQAVEMVMAAFKFSQGGEIFIPRIPSMHINDMATAIVPDAELVEVGIRNGEKLHETLVSEDCGNVYFIDNVEGEKYGDAPFLTHASPGYTSDTNTLWLGQRELRQILGLEPVYV